MARPSSLREALRRLLPVAHRLSPHLRQERTLLAGGSLALVAEVLMRLVEPWPIKFILDRYTGHADALPGAKLVPEDPQHLVIACALAVVLVALGRAAAAYASTVAFALAGNRVLTRVRNELFVHVQGLQGRFHDRARGGDLVVRVIGDVGLLKEVMVTALLPLVANVLILAGMIAIMAWMDAGLTLLALVLFPLLALRTVSLGSKIRKVSREQRKREGALASTAAEAFGAIGTVQALSLEPRFSRAFQAEGSRDLKEGVKSKRLQAGLERSVDVLVAGSTALVLGWGAHRMFAGHLTPGDLVVFLAYLKNAFKPMKSVAKYTARLAKAAAAGERVLELLDQEPEVVEHPQARVAPAFRGALRLEAVRFRYDDGDPVLDGVDLEVGPGERVALVGPSGTGKSTLAALLLRLRDPEEGRILLDGHDIRAFTLASLRSQVAVLLQDSALFATTLRENIACVAPDADEGAIRRALALAGADTFVSKLPGGLDTPVGERGATLSRGERQRIAMARLALMDSPYLVLDEPTTGLDSHHRDRVIEGLERLSRGRTTLVITHDHDLAARMDRVIHLRGGHLHEVRDGVRDEAREVRHALPA